MSADPFESLNDRERECLRLSAEGFEAQDIADAMGKSVHTVHGYCRQIIAKTGASNMKRAALQFRRSLPAPQRLSDQPPSVPYSSIPHQEPLTDLSDAMVRDVGQTIQQHEQLRPLERFDRKPERGNAPSHPSRRLVETALLVLLIGVILILAPQMGEGFQDIARFIRNTLN